MNSSRGDSRRKSVAKERKAAETELGNERGKKEENNDYRHSIEAKRKIRGVEFMVQIKGRFRTW